VMTKTSRVAMKYSAKAMRGCTKCSHSRPKPRPARPKARPKPKPKAAGKKKRYGR
jgi:hypothetical protein